MQQHKGIDLLVVNGDDRAGGDEEDKDGVDSRVCGGSRWRNGRWYCRHLR